MNPAQGAAFERLHSPGLLAGQALGYSQARYAAWALCPSLLGHWRLGRELAVPPVPQPHLPKDWDRKHRLRVSSGAWMPFSSPRGPLLCSSGLVCPVQISQLLKEVLQKLSARQRRKLAPLSPAEHPADAPGLCLLKGLKEKKAPYGLCHPNITQIPGVSPLQ